MFIFIFIIVPNLVTIYSHARQLSKEKAVLGPFSLRAVVQTMTQSRCKSWDHPELNCLEAYKYISMFLCQINATAFYLLSAPVENPWQVLNFFKMITISVVVSAQIAVEAFHMFSAFFAAYHLF